MSDLEDLQARLLGLVKQRHGIQEDLEVGDMLNWPGAHLDSAGHLTECWASEPHARDAYRAPCCLHLIRGPVMYLGPLDVPHIDFGRFHLFIDLPTRVVFFKGERTGYFPVLRDVVTRWRIDGAVG